MNLKAPSLATVVTPVASRCVCRGSLELSDGAKNTFISAVFIDAIKYLQVCASFLLF
jgi:hypothetical protein